MHARLPDARANSVASILSEPDRTTRARARLISRKSFAGLGEIPYRLRSLLSDSLSRSSCLCVSGDLVGGVWDSVITRGKRAPFAVERAEVEKQPLPARYKTCPVLSFLSPRTRIFFQRCCRAVQRLQPLLGCPLPIRQASSFDGFCFVAMRPRWRYFEAPGASNYRVSPPIEMSAIYCVGAATARRAAYGGAAAAASGVAPSPLILNSPSPDDRTEKCVSKARQGFDEVWMPCGSILTHIQTLVMHRSVSFFAVYLATSRVTHRRTQPVFLFSSCRVIALHERPGSRWTRAAW